MAKLLLLCMTSLPLPFIILSVLQHSHVVNGANILAILPSVWQSHYIFGKRLLHLLVEQQNHTVTLITPYASPATEDTPKDDAVSKIREIHVDKLMENWLDMGLSFDIEQAHQQSMLERFTRLIYAGTANVDLLLADVNVRSLLRSGEKFDLLIIDLFLSDALLGLAFYYNMPTVVISPNGANTWLNRMFGNPQSSALDPSNFLPYTERMTIRERCANTLMGLFEKLTYNFFHMISQQAVYVKHFQALNQLANNNSVPLPHHRDLTHNLSLALINSHPVIQYPRALLPNVLPVGGVHLYDEKDSHSHDIPHHLKLFMESSSNGVVYFSLGADARTVDLAREKLDALLDVISYMKDLNFLVKWETDEYPKDLPSNLLINDWFPQEAILAHPKVKVFITSCGLMSVIESLNGLTPMLAIPIYPEQSVTAMRLESHGLALMVQFDELNYTTVLNGIQELIKNESYASRILEANQQLKSEYGSPAARSLHYIDVVLRTGGADFLKTHAHHLNFMRTKLFDVIAILTLGFSGILAIPFLLICCILKRSYYNNESQVAINASTLPLAHSKTAFASTKHRSKVTKKNQVNPNNITTTASMPISLQSTISATNLSCIKRQRSASTILPSNAADICIPRSMSSSACSTTSSSSSATTASFSPEPIVNMFEEKREKDVVMSSTSTPTSQ